MKKRFLSMMMVTILALSVVMMGSVTCFAEEAAAEEAEISINIDELEEVTFIMTSPLPTVNMMGYAAQQTAVYIEELSGGKMKVDFHPGGELCSETEDLQYVADGSTDMCQCMPTYFKEYIPTFNYAGNQLGGSRAATDFSRWLYMENEETAAIVNEEFEAYGVKLIGIVSAPENGFCSKKEIKGWDDLQGLMLGTGAFVSTFQALGLDVQQITVTDTYESLSRGVIDLASAGFATIYANKYYEICPNILEMNVANGTIPIFMNLDKWNSLSPAAQEVVTLAAKKALDDEIAFQAGQNQQCIDAVTEIGGTVNYMTDADKIKFVRQVYLGNYKDYYPSAEAIGRGEQFDTLALAAIEKLGLDITLDELKAQLN